MSSVVFMNYMCIYGKQVVYIKYSAIIHTFALCETHSWSSLIFVCLYSACIYTYLCEESSTHILHLHIFPIALSEFLLNKILGCQKFKIIMMHLMICIVVNAYRGEFIKNELLPLKAVYLHVLSALL